jgi:hypothetical protein
MAALLLYNGPMFSLSESQLADIAFAMEDQGRDALIDLLSGEIAYPDSVDALDEADEEADYSDADRWASLPEWSSADGFRLMEEFSQTVTEPEAALALSAALSRHKGVFRAFKEALSSFPDLEKRFFAFKDARMRSVIREWYALIASSDPEAREMDGGELRGAEFELRDIEPPVARALLRGFLGDPVAGLPPLILAHLPDAARDILLRELDHSLARGARCVEARLESQEPPGARGDESLAGLLVYVPLEDRLSAEGRASVLFLESRPEYADAEIEARLLSCLRARGYSLLLLHRYTEASAKPSVLEKPLRLGYSEFGLV